MALNDFLRDCQPERQILTWTDQIYLFERYFKRSQECGPVIFCDRQKLRVLDRQAEMRSASQIARRLKVRVMICFAS